MVVNREYRNVTEVTIQTSDHYLLCATVFEPVVTVKNYKLKTAIIGSGK